MAFSFSLMGLKVMPSTKIFPNLDKLLIRFNLTDLKKIHDKTLIPSTSGAALWESGSLCWGWGSPITQGMSGLH